MTLPEQQQTCGGSGCLTREGCADCGQPLLACPWVYDDGGRASAGFRGLTGDCVCRAAAIASGHSYLSVYEAINVIAAGERPRKSRRNGRTRSRSSARTGVSRPTTRTLMDRLNFTWTPTMAIGSGCRVHLRPDELPAGRIVVQLSGHVCAVVDGVVHDTHDPSRGGTRCVYGYWSPA